jgi:SH3-like domain-containing protein
MKMNYGLIFATMLSTAVIAQPMPAPDGSAAAPAASPVPPEAGVKPAAKPKKTPAKKTAAKKTSDKSATAAAASPLVTNEMAVAVKNNVVVRGQAHINSEIVGHLKKGDPVLVLEIVTLKHPATDEPANWARIALPADMHAWLNSSFINASNETVSARKLNLRSGPGENYSVIGLLHKGDAVKTVTNKGQWTEIEPPTNTFAFVAAHLLAHQEAPPAAAPPTVVENVAPPVPQPVPQPAPTVVGNPNTIAGPASGVPGATAPVAVTPPVPPPSAPFTLPPVAPPVHVAPAPLPKRIIEREGTVGGTVSIQAPSHYKLKSLDDGRVIDYLYSTSTNLVLQRYKGLTVLVTGEEELDERWPDTPVLTIQKIQVVK